jgi:hypothetical protein
MATNIAFWLRNPHLLPARVIYWLWERRNPDKPWLCRGTIRFCEQKLSNTMQGVEFGSGGSTAWFAKHIGHLTSIEHSEEWYLRVQADLQRQQVRNVNYHLIPLDHPEVELEPEGGYDPAPAYVAILDGFANESLDLVAVDGHYRTTCIRFGVEKLKPGGFLLVDDVNLWPKMTSLPVPSGWDLVDKSSNGLKTTCIWRKPVESRSTQKAYGGD